MVEKTWCKIQVFLFLRKEKNMKEAFKHMLKHPIATSIIIASVLGGVANVISAVKNKETKESE